MTARRWWLLAILAAAFTGVLVGSAIKSDRVLNDPTGYSTRDPALPSESPYVRRPLHPIPSWPWIPPLETR